MRTISFLLLPLMASCFLVSFKVEKKRPKVIFFGDSITEAGIHPDGYIAQLRDTFQTHKKTAGYQLLGAGIGGNKIYDLYLRLENDILAQKPRIVVIYVGVNDVWHRKTFGTGTDPDKFQQFYQAILQKLQKNRIKAILCTPACIGEQKPGDNELDMELDLFSNIIRQIGQKWAIPVCDLRNAFQKHSQEHNPANQPQGILTTDGVHLNHKGNALVAKLLFPELKKWIDP